jgi:hypothetical protein
MRVVVVNDWVEREERMSCKGLVEAQEEWRSVYGLRRFLVSRTRRVMLDECWRPSELTEVTCFEMRDMGVGLSSLGMIAALLIFDGVSSVSSVLNFRFLGGAGMVVEAWVEEPGIRGPKMEFPRPGTPLG